MKTILFFFCLCLACIIAAADTLTSNNIVTISWPTAGTVYSNAQSIQIGYSTNYGVYTNILKVGSAQGITVTNFPLGVQYFYQFTFYSDTNYQNQILTPMTGIPIGFNLTQPPLQTVPIQVSTKSTGP